MRHPQIIELPDKSQAVVGLLAMVALVILAVAVWQIAAALSIGCILVSGGIGIRQACEGVGCLLYQKRRGDAEVARQLAMGRARLEAHRIFDITPGDEAG